MYMSNQKTPEEVKKEYIDIMGEPLGKFFNALWQEVAWLYTKWNEYVALYGTKPSRIDLMNKAAPRFFRIVQDSLWEVTLLHIARLTDPPKSAGKDNLSIKRIPQLLSDQKLIKAVEAKIEIASQKSEFCRDWRNRRIAHRDLKLAIEEGINPLKPASRKMVKEALDSIADVLNIVTQYYKESTTIFDAPNDSGGGESLLYVIDDGLKWDEEKTKRIQRGDIREEDYQVRDI
jgi:hypothetical protein